MKVAIVGVGAIGGYVGHCLAQSGEDVTFIARGKNLEALRSGGIRLLRADGSEQVVPKVEATADYAATGPQDLVILALKAHQLESVALDVPKLFGPDTIVVPMQNGIPYWYFHGHPGELAGTRLQSVDPSGLISDNIPAQRVIGCVVYPATELLEPGVIKHVEGNRFPVGEPDGTTSQRVALVADCFVRAGLQAAVLGDIRAEIWLKLWGNMTFNVESHVAPQFQPDLGADVAEHRSLQSGPDEAVRDQRNSLARRAVRLAHRKPIAFDMLDDPRLHQFDRRIHHAAD